jgi:peptidyl-prolyl cis-trans isomerase SurA
LDSVRTLINDKKITFSQAVKDYSDKTAQSYHNDGRMVNPSSGNTFFETRDLDPDIYFATESMKLTELSKPIEVRTPMGEVQYRVARLNTRTEPHRANLLQDYNKIQQATLETKKSKFVNDWLLQKVSGTYMTIEDDMKGACPNVDRWLVKTNKTK